jgi:hypothetical protein
MTNLKEVIFTQEDGRKTLWRYDLDISKVNPIEVVQDYNPTKDKHQPVKIKQPAKEITPNESLPAYKQRYLNPSTGAYISYSRAKQLGII